MPLSDVLKEIPAQDLIEELATRYDAMIYVAIKDDDITLYLNGSSVVCNGLLTHAQSEILWASFNERPLS